MDKDLEQSLKDIINNLINISKEKDLEIKDLKEKLKKERYIKRYDRKRYKRIDFENMILLNKIKSIKDNNFVPFEFPLGTAKAETTEGINISFK